MGALMQKFTTQKVWLDLGKARSLDELDHHALPGLKASRRVLETGELEASVRQQTDALRDELIALQERLYAERKQSLSVKCFRVLIPRGYGWPISKSPALWSYRMTIFGGLMQQHQSAGRYAYSIDHITRMYW
jgi:hypothetical protein